VKVLPKLRARKMLRLAGIALTIVVVMLASAIVSTLTVDLGPALRTYAEAGGSRLLGRTVRIGALKVRLAGGRMELSDVSIGGLRPDDRTFFTARRLLVSLDWSKALAPRPEFVITSLEMSDWEMLVERWAHEDSFPRFRRDPDAGPRPFTVTLSEVRASGGRFIYEDHETPWSIVAPNIDIHVSHDEGYTGDAVFTGGLISIQRYVPMWANMKARFAIDGSTLRLHPIEFETDGALSQATGSVDFSRWPEQSYQVTSKVQFQRMREIFFARQRWNLSGTGDFTGRFHLFKGGHDLSGSFMSGLAGVDNYRFPSLYGSLHWTRSGFEVTDAGSRFLGGEATFGFAIQPLGSRTRPTARFDVAYAGVDLKELSNFYALAGLRFSGSASGTNLLEWPLGQFSERTGQGRLSVLPPSGVEVMDESLDGARAADSGHASHEWGPFGPGELPAHLPIAGDLTYRFGPALVEIDPSRFATERTHVAFSGSTSWSGQDLMFRFRATSADWQESDQVLAGILTSVGSPTRPTSFGGRGEFDGTLTGSLRRTRVEGRFTGEDLRAWDTIWGEGSAHIVVENGYVQVTDGVVRRSESEIRADGLFSLSYPRRDGGEQINARFRVRSRDLDSLRHAFALDDWPVSGTFSGEFRLTGQYSRPLGFGAMTVDNGMAFGEPFERGTASLRFDGGGVRLDAVNIAKSGGVITGAAYVGWEGTYSFNADGRKVPIDRMASFRLARAQPSGIVEFTAEGNGPFADPRYDVRFRVNDLAVAGEPVGLVTGTLALRGGEIRGELVASSPRLSITGTGRIALNARAESDLTFRFHDSTLDPYVRLFVPKLSPYASAVATGSVHLAGQLADVDRLLVEATVDRVDISLLDNAIPNARPLTITNARPLRLALDQHVVRLRDVELVGEETRLTIGGTVELHEERIGIEASGDASLGILQAVFRDVRGSGHAALTAAVNGPLYEPVFSGSATITNGRVRHFSLPNSLDGINGTIRFDSRGIQLDDVAATVGGGRVQFGGRVALEAYLPGDLNVIARGENITLRYPAGVRSTVDADLAIRGNVKAPTLAGVVTVRSAVWSRRIDPTAGLLDFSRASTAEARPASPSAVPLRFDVEVRVPSTLRVENNLARLVARADLQLRGTFDRPVLFGRAEVDRGEVTFEGRRYLVTRGNIDFTNPTRIEPFFDVEAETRVRVPGQTYQVIVGLLGTMDRMLPELSSDPPLPAADVVALLLGEVRRPQGPGDVELLAYQNRTDRPRDVLTTRATQILANPVASEVGRVVEQAFGVDTFQLSPSLIDPYSQSTIRVNPSARLTIGKRISDRVYLTFSRSLSSSIADQILLLEYDESDRLSWILSRNEDSTYAIEVRVRHSF
jgi:hypothetical protein